MKFPYRASCIVAFAILTFGVVVSIGTQSVVYFFLAAIITIACLILIIAELIYAYHKELSENIEDLKELLKEQNRR